MFIFHNPHNNLFFQCSIVSYQFPDLSNDNWCLFEVKIEQDNNRFVKIDPAIETTDIVRLADWFQSLADYKLPKSAALYFTEPCITFHYYSYSNSGIRIGIELCHELKPDFRLRESSIPPCYQDHIRQEEHNANRGWNMVFTLSPEELNTMADKFRKLSKRFPVRK